MTVYGVPGLTDSEAILTSRDFIFIKECILGGPLPGEKEFIGRPDRSQEWLYDIVSNRRSGLDVDKLDYFARDERLARLTRA
jgi:deoxynucleoside triphosphate triphosphohydrolase SAMHD1